MSGFGAESHTAHTLAHIEFRKKCGDTQLVLEYRLVSRSRVVLGKYRLLERVRDVDVGDAYLAKLAGMEGFEKPVLLWCRPARPTEDAKLRNALVLEANQGASLSHAGIAQVLGLDRVDGLWILAMEYVAGCTLGEALRALGELPWTLIARIGVETSQALAYAHGRRNDRGELLRLTHRRLSPRRIALGDAGDIKITGFGASNAWMAPGAYRAPEEDRGEPVDGRADVYSLAVILRECLLQGGVPASMDRLLDDALHPHPERRPTAGAMHHALTGILHAAERPTTAKDVADVVALAARQPQAGPDPSFTDYLIRTSEELVTKGAIFAALDRLEIAADSTKLSRAYQAVPLLQLYERLGRLSVDAHVGERGVTRMTRALDLASGFGRDDYAARFCTLRGELLGQADRGDESEDWLERAANLRG